MNDTSVREDIKSQHEQTVIPGIGYRIDLKLQKIHYHCIQMLFKLILFAIIISNNNY